MEKWLEEKEEGKWTEFPNYAQRAKEINQSILRIQDTTGKTELRQQRKKRKLGN